MANSSPHHPSKSPQKPTFRPLTVVQENAIDALLLGQTDGDVAATVGVNRSTVWEWRTQHPLFMATLEQRRADLWRAPQEKLRSLAMKAIENLATAIDNGNLRASLELLKCIGLYGVVAPAGATDPETVLRQHVAARVKQEGAEDNPTQQMLIDLVHPGSYQRKQEIEAELRERYTA
jgi:hypothetical protein